MLNRDRSVPGGGYDSSLAEEEIRSCLQRALDSRAFRAAHGQRKFLKFVVEETLAGRGGQIKEFTVAVEALGRGDSFDPRVDPIIRTEARKLRLRLAKYYSDEGQNDPILIELPKGTYVPSFALRRSLEEIEESEPLQSDYEEAAPDVQQEPSKAELPVPSPVRTFRGLFLAVPLLAIAGLLGLGFWLLSVRKAAGRVSSIAVMPFVNRSGDPSHDSVINGITASLTQRLEGETGIRVAGRSSVSRVSLLRTDIRDLKQRLRVGAVLIGGLENASDTLRLRVRLIEGPEAAPVWSGSYTFEAQTHQAIEAEITEEVLHALRTGKPAKFNTPFQKAQRVSSAGWSAYLKGLHLQARLDAHSLSRAIEHLESATKLDPSFARAWSALATSWVLAAQVSSSPAAEVAGRIRQLATRAVELDPALGDAHFSLAVCAEYDYDWQTADREFRTGLALSPSSTLGHLWYAKYLALTGRHHEVLVHRTFGAELDPLSPYAIQAVAGYWSVAGEYRQAIDGFQSALVLDPNFGLAKQGLGIAYLLIGRGSAAVQQLEEAAAQQRGLRTQALLGYAYGMTGRTRDAQAMLAEFEARARRGPFPALAIAHIYLGLGDKDNTFEWLQKAVDQRDLNATLQWDSLYVPLRSDPRYRQLLKRMKLA